MDGFNSHGTIVHKAIGAAVPFPPIRGARTYSMRQREKTSKVPQQRLHSWYTWQCGFCNLQNLKGVRIAHVAPSRSLRLFTQAVELGSTRGECSFAHECRLAIRENCRLVLHRLFRQRPTRRMSASKRGVPCRPANRGSSFSHTSQFDRSANARSSQSKADA